jgi:hypothetical protein
MNKNSNVLLFLSVVFILVIAIGVYFYTKYQAQHATSSVPVSVSAIITGNEANPARLSVKGDEVIAPDGQPIVLRGFNWGDWDTAQAQDGTDNITQGANIVRIPLSWYFGSGTGATDCKTGQDSYDLNSPQTGYINPANLAILDQTVAWASSAHLWVDLMVRGGDCDFWTNPTIIPQYVQMWQFLASRYKDTPYIGAYELLSEPHPPKNLGNPAVKGLYEKLIAAIKPIDPNTPYVVGAASVYNVRSLEGVYMSDQNDLIYTFDFFELPDYVKEEKSPGDMTGYPGTYADKAPGNEASCTNYPGAGQTVHLDKSWLAGLLTCATNFRSAHNVPIWANQIGIRTETPGSTQYINDVLDLFRTDNIGFAWWTYRNRYTQSDDIVGEGAGPVYQNSNGTWSTQTNLMNILTTYLKGGTNE